MQGSRIVIAMQVLIYEEEVVVECAVESGMASDEEIDVFGIQISGDEE
jgi:hypothetical protein